MGAISPVILKVAQWLAGVLGLHGFPLTLQEHTDRAIWNLDCDPQWGQGPM